MKTTVSCPGTTRTVARAGSAAAGNMHAVLGLAQHQAGRLAVFGDANCLDSSHMRSACFRLLTRLIAYVTTARSPARLHNLCGLQRINQALPMFLPVSAGQPAGHMTRSRDAVWHAASAGKPPCTTQHVHPRGALPAGPLAAGMPVTASLIRLRLSPGHAGRDR
jgi:hypothetical protein